MAIIGAAFSANKGAAAMLDSVIERLPEVAGPCEFAILSTYPTEDAEERPDLAEQLVPAKPFQLVFPMLPLAILAWVLRNLRLPTKWAGASRAMRSMLDADIVLDLAGISFSDGRGLPILGYNVLMTGIPVLTGTPVVKGSQALGPFRNPLNRAVARMILPRLTAICARGPTTVSNLESIGITDSIETGDLAFAMKMTEGHRRRAGELLGATGSPLIVISPSTVVDRYSQRLGLDYPAMMTQLIEHSLTRGYRVAIIPHSYRVDADNSHLNDGPLCRAIFRSLGETENVDLVDSSETPGTLRAIIERADILVTSRFHAMISALATATPVLVISWSHKYAEVMNQFDMGHLVLAHTELTGDTLIARFSEVEEDRRLIRQTIDEHLPRAEESALRTFHAIAHLATHSLGRPDA